MSEWIKCSDRLPEINGNYLVYDGEEIWMTSYKWHRKEGNILGFGLFFKTDPPYVSGEITHWMPLPKPPEEK